MTLTELFYANCRCNTLKRHVCDNTGAQFPQEISDISSNDLLYYAGEYTVTPKTSSQTLETRDRVMTENLTVGKIPYFEVTNTANGKTVTIA